MFTRLCDLKSRLINQDKLDITDVCYIDMLFNEQRLTEGHLVALERYLVDNVKAEFLNN